MRRVALISGAVLASAAALVSGCSSPDSHESPAASGPPKVSPPAVQQAGTLKVCIDNDGAPPGVYHDESGALIGSEIDLAKNVAAQLNLKAQFVESSFAAMIPGLQAKQCDVIMASLYIKPEREAIVDFVPYLYSGTGIAVSKEHPAAITGMDDSLCGKKVMVIVGTTAESLAREQSTKCTAGGRSAVDVNLNSRPDVSIQQVQNGQMDALIDAAETLGYYATKTGAQIRMVGAPFGKIQIGAATLKGNTPLHDAVAQAITALENDGTYAKTLDKWGQADLSIAK